MPARDDDQRKQPQPRRRGGPSRETELEAMSDDPALTKGDPIVKTDQTGDERARG